MSDEALPPGVYWVNPGHLLAGPYPMRALDRLLDTGITHFVNLTEPGELPPYGDTLPPGVTHQRCSIRDFNIPTVPQMRAILDALDTALDEGKTVYVHCWGGIGRTGTVIGCWLVRHGLSGATALDEITRLRGYAGSPETDEQRAFVRGWTE